MKQTASTFTIRTYSKRQLAMLYFPDIDPDSATKRLLSWIRLCTPLQEALLAHHYYSRQRLLTPHQVQLIVEHLGEP